MLVLPLGHFIPIAVVVRITCGCPETLNGDRKPRQASSPADICTALNIRFTTETTLSPKPTRVH